MGRPRKAPKLSPDGPELAKRLNLLLNRLWQGNASRMARDLNVSQPAFARMLAGQPPSARLLESLARHPEINLRWLLAGEGEPLSSHTIGAGGGHYLPIADSLLPATPKECPERLTYATFPVAAGFWSDTAYWYRLTGREVLVTEEACRFRWGDFLLIETAVSWTQRPEAFAGRLVVLRLPKTATPIFAAIEDEDYFEVERLFEVDTFGQADVASLNASKSRPEDDLHRPTTKRRRSIVQLYLGDIAGVILQSVRLLDDWR